LRPFEVLGAMILLAAAGAFLAGVLIAAVIVRYLPLVVAAFVAIIVARWLGVIQ